MSGYYEWQKQQANERVQARLHEANEHRRAKEGHGEGGINIRASLLVTALLGVIILFLILNGCAPEAGASSSMESAVRKIPVLTMADRIQFQDGRDESYDYGVGTAVKQNAASMTMADRLRFHDSILEKNQ